MEERAVQLQKNLSKFIKHVDDLVNEDDPAGNGFHREYRELRETAAQHKEENKFPSTVGREPHNMKKNRYKDIIAYDHTRVTLEDMGIKGSDYINANLIQDPYLQDGYIASQGPLPHTVDDFWRMIMEYKVKVVIMACKLIEGTKKKCAPYWPETVEGEEDYGDVHVIMIKESDMTEDCTVRVFEASYGDESHQVTQYHYTGWPDHGIPEDRDVILSMVAKMRDIRHRDIEKGPVLVHCSAGCGRTGTVCAIDYAWEILRGGKLTSDFELKKIVESMREQRQSMIQTPDQYEMAHLAVRDLFQKHLEIMEENIYMNYGGDAEEQAALDSFDMVTDAESTNKDNEDVYSYSSAAKILQESLMDTVNMYTSEDGIPGDILQPIVETKPVPPANKPSLPTKDPNVKDGVDQDTKPVVKNKYVNVDVSGTSYENVDVTGTSYENVDLVTLEEQESSIKSTPPTDKKYSPKPTKKVTPPASPVKKQPSSPIFAERKTEGPLFTGKPAEGPVFTGKPAEGPVFTGKPAEGPVFTGKPAEGPVFTGKPAEGPVFTGKPAEGPVFTGKSSEALPFTGKQKDVPVVKEKKSEVPMVTSTSGTSVYSFASNEPAKPASSGPQFIPSGPTWSSAPAHTEVKKPNKPLRADKVPNNSILQTQPDQSVPRTNVSTGVVEPSTNNRPKHVTKITVGAAVKPTHGNKKPSETNNNVYSSVGANTKEEKPSGSSFSANTAGDVYSVVKRDSSIKRSSQGHSDPKPAPQQDVYSQVSRTPETGFQGHVLGGDGSYSEVVLGQPAKVGDNLYSYVAANSSSSDDVQPEIPDRGYRDPPREPPRDPPPRGPVHTDTHNATTLKNTSVDQKFRGLITKIKGGTSDHQYTDTSNIRGFPERIGQKPMGKREEPSRWKKIFKHNK